MSNLGPTVRDGKIRFLSVSQLEKFDPEVYGGCERRWWFRYVGRQKEAEQQQHKLGKQVHAQVEHYLKTGEGVLGSLAQAGRRFLPRPGSDLLVEYAFAQPAWPGPLEAPVESPLTAANVPLLGSVDCLNPRGEWVDDAGLLRAEPSCVEVVDWKTTKRIDDELDDVGRVRERGYAKTAEQLAATWQMVGYGEVARLRYSPASVRLSHGYFQTQGRPTASKRSVSLPAAEVQRRWSRADVLVERMKSVAGAKRVEDVPPNYGACSAYRGCPHREKCPRDAKVVLAELLSPGAAARLLGAGGPMSLIEKMKAKKAAEAAAKAGTPAPTEVKPEIKAEMAKLEAEERAARITPPDLPAPDKVAEEHEVLGVHVACGTPLTVMNSSRLQDGTLKHVGCAATAAAAKDPHVHERKPAAAPAASPSGGCARGGEQVELDIDAVASKKYACACGEALKVKPQKLPDGKYYALVPKHGQAPAAPTPAPTPPPSANTGDLDPQRVYDALSAGKGAIAPISGLLLYLDSIEDGVVAERLEPYAGRLARQLEAEYSAADLRCAPEQSPLSFGKWKGALAALARANPPAGAYLCSSTDEVAYEVFKALAPSAARVVRGVR